MFGSTYGYGQSPMMQYYDRYNSFAQPPMQPQPTQTAGQIIRVNGEPGAKAFTMPPNSSAILLDENQDVFYLKSTDGAGYATINAYEFKPVQAVTNPVTSNFVTREEFEELKGLIFDEQHTKQTRRTSDAGQSNHANDK